MIRFTIATLTLAGLMALAVWQGGLWVLAALLAITVGVFALDRVAALAAPDQPDLAFPAGDGLAVALGLAQFPLLYGGIVALTGPAAVWEKAALFVALSLFLGQIGNSNAHELIHRSGRWMRRLGVAVYCSVLFGHHTSAHMRVHHVHAATPRDPATARLGEGFWRYLWRAWRGGLREGYRAETLLRGGKGWHPYRAYALGAVASLGLAAAAGGWAGLGWLLALAGYVQLQLFLSDYVQHYGLLRRETARGVEPMGPQHSWNAPQPASSAMMLNAPRHSDHHTSPARPYPGLRIDRAAMPILPQSLPVMAVLALLPPLWRRIMDPRARAWAAEDRPLTRD